MNRRACISTRIATCLLLLAAPLLANAGRYQPKESWLEAVRVPEPFLPYRLGVVEFEEGASGEWLEYLGDLRATLRGANYFQRTDAPRLRLQIARGYQDGGADEKGCKSSSGTLALTYRFLDGEREVNRFSITTQAPVSGSDNDLDAAMAGNLKYLLLELRKGQGDGAFATQAVALENAVQSELGKGSSLGCKVGVVLARGFVATVEGTVAVVKGASQVAGAALEVAASPEFQSAMNTAMAEQQRQQAQHQAFMDNINAQAEADRQQREAQQRAQAQQLAAQQAAQQQAGREAFAKQLADGIAYRNMQMSQTNDPATLQRLRRDNEGALQAAQQMGVRSQVDGMATQATQSGFDQARAQRAADEQAQQQRIAEQARIQREREAQQRAEQQRLAAEQAAAERKRKEEDARLARQREAEQQRLAAERLKHEKEAALRTGFRGRATTCTGGGSGILYLQTSTPPKMGCNVQFEARCPGTQPGNGVRFGQNNYVGGSCMGIGDAIQIGQMSCPADQVQIEMTGASCG